MGLSIKIGGTERVGYYVPGSLSAPAKIEERSQADFDMVVNDTTGYSPTPLQPISIYNGTALLFAGFIWSIDEQLAVDDANRTERFLKVSCVDNHLLADRRLVAETYDGKTAGYIVRDLLTKYLAADGVVAGAIQEGPIVTRAVFNYSTFADAMAQLSELAGFFWRITNEKTLDFADRSTNTAPWALTAKAKVRSVKVRRHPEQYRNRQYIRAGQDTTALRTESFNGNAQNKTFTLSFPVAKVPTVTVNGTAKTVGIRGVDQGKDFYWNKNDPVISQDDAGTALTATDKLDVKYQGLFPIIIVSDATTDVNAHGAFEAVDEAATLDNVDAAREFASAKLRRYARISGEVSFDTEQPGLAPGQLLAVDLPNLGLSGAWLIQEVNFSDFGVPGDNVFRYQIKALDGEPVGGWEAFFRKMTQHGTGYAIRDNEVLVKLKNQYDSAVISDTLTKMQAAPESRAGYAVVGFSEVG